MQAARARAQSYSTFEQPQPRARKHAKCCSHQNSKSVVLILLWAIVINFIRSAMETALPFALSRQYNNDSHRLLLYSIVLLYMLLAAAMMCYPLGGFLADVYIGRYRTVIASLLAVTLSMLVALILIIFTLELNIAPTSGLWKRVSFIAGGLLAYVLLMVGLAGFNSNIVQLSLDQLMDVPSHKLGIFIHLLIWASRVGQFAFQLPYTLKQCAKSNSYKDIREGLLLSLPACTLVTMLALLTLNCCTHKMFNKERVKYNPFKMILKVLNFARKHKYPVGHWSAFAYSDSIQPSRLDFAKERYGGPFSTSDVEDVKTFTRVFLLLLTLGPIFAIGVPTSYFLFGTFATHLGSVSIDDLRRKCTLEWLLLDSSSLAGVTSVVVFPIYTWLLFSVLLKRNMLPRILTRIQLATLFYAACILYMSATELTGHVLRTSTGDRNLTCMFLNPGLLFTPTPQQLDLHWSILIFPNLTMTLGLDLIMATAFEFISAQSPHTMKGVLVGVLYAARGFFQLLEAVLLLPFSFREIWTNNVPEFSCGLGYYLVTTALSLTSFVLLVVAVKKYKYRKRDEEPFSQYQVEEVYERMLQNRAKTQDRRAHAIAH